MKQFLLILLLFFTSLIGFSQIYQNPNPTLYGIRYNRGKFDSTLHYPTVCGKPVGRAALKDNVYNQSAFVFDSCHNHLYAFNPKDSSWLCVDSSNTATTDTSNLSARINKKVDSVYKVNDSTIGFKINGTAYSFLIRGNIKDSIYTFATPYKVKSDSIILATAINGKQATITPSSTVKQYWNGYKTFASLLTDSINEGSANKYYTDARARSSLSATSPLVYNSSTGSFSINTLDSTNVSGLHSEGYYNTKYAAVGSSGGLTGSGTVSSSIVPFATWSITNSKLSNTSTYLTEDTTSGKITFNSSVTASGAKAIGTIVTDTLKAAANSDTLSALELAPTFISNGKTGLTNAVLRWANGNIVERGSVLPSSYGSTDVILKQNTQLISAFNSNNSYYGYMQLSNLSASPIIGTTYNSGKINFVVGSNTSYFDGGGNLFCNGSANIGNTGSLTATAPNGTIGNIFPMNSSGQTIIQNGYANSSASIIFKTSPITNGIFVEQARFTYGGKLLLNTTSDDGVNQLQVNGSAKATQYRLSALNTAPASSTDTGTTGEIRVTSTYIYICTTTNTWVRTALSTF